MPSQDLIMTLHIFPDFSGKIPIQGSSISTINFERTPTGRGHKPFGVTFQSKWVLRGSDMRIRGKSPRPILPKRKVVPPANLTTAVHIHIIETKIT